MANESTSEILFEIILALADISDSAKSVLIQKENFNKFSAHLERTAFILRELSRSDIKTFNSFRNSLEILEKEIKVGKELTLKCSNRSKLYLFLNSRKIVKHLEGITKEISQALGLISLACSDGSSVMNGEISELWKNMLDTEYNVSRTEEEILEKIESGIEEMNVDQSYANNLLICMAEALEISTNRSELKREFEEFKTEMENDEQREDLTEASRMEQIIALLSEADMITTPKEKEIRYLSKRSSLGRQQIEPLPSFYCAITGDIMVDPVETSSGQTFERSAIEKWLEDGNNLCPLTKIPLNTSLLRSNKTLRNSIQEWKDRNTMILIASLKQKIQSDEEQEVIDSFQKLQDLCSERELHLEWIIIEDYIPILVGLLSAKSSEIRKHVLSFLCILAEGNDGIQEKIAKEDNAIEFIVRSLARKVEESKLALLLLLELSRHDKIRNSIGSAQGCILLLVTLSNSDDNLAAKDARELLEILSFNDQNVIQMAKANYFGPLLRHLSSGPESIKTTMAKTLSDIELTDHSKLSLFKDGALEPLLQLLSHGDRETKEAAAKALQNLSSIPQNGLQMIREGAVRQLFELLYHHRLSTPSLRGQIAATVMQLAISNITPEATETRAALFESEEEIFKFFSLVSLTGPDVQESILQTFIAACQSSAGFEVRSTLRQISATRVLVQLCELDNCKVRANAVKLFCCLTEDSDDSTFIEHVDQRCIEELLRITKTTDNPDEIAAVLGIISNLPKVSQMTQWLLDAGALQVIFPHIANGDNKASNRKEVVENASAALCRFTVSSNQEWQTKVAEAGFIPVLVQLLFSETAFTKQNVAISLKQLSESSPGLSLIPAKKNIIFGCCFASSETGYCPIHLGICTMETSFCLLEADAIRPLVRALSDENTGASEASFDALMTLIEGNQLQNGSKVLDEADGIAPMIKLLSSSAETLKERALKAVERFFQLVEIRRKYKALAQLPLVDITQRGSSSMKSLAAKTLGHLNVLHEQSSYF